MRTERAILDTGPLVAFFREQDAHHAWAVKTFQRLELPFVTCEAVLAEACYILRRDPTAQEKLFKFVADRYFDFRFHLAEHLEEVTKLMRKYCSIPASLADACLVRTAELHDNLSVFTLDTHFRIYRKHGRQVIPLMMPDES